MEPFEAYPDDPVYNIRAVTQQTQIDPTTLRAWERRYQLPKPKRDVQGHRLYSERDIMILRWLKSKVDASIRIKQAVELLYMQSPQRMEADALPMPSRAQLQNVPQSEQMGQLLDAFFDAIQRFDYPAAQQVLSHALSLHAIEAVCVEFLIPVMGRLGRAWEEGTITLQTEHFASSLIRERLQAILASSPHSTRQARLVIGCAPQDWHELGVLILSLILRRRGWEVIYLGQNVGLDGLSETLAQLKPSVLALSVSRLPGYRFLPDAHASLMEATQNRGIFAFGGRLFTVLPQLAEALPGLYLGASLIEAVDLLEQVLMNSQADVGLPSTTGQPGHHLKHFIDKRPQLEGEALTLLLSLIAEDSHTQAAQAVHELMEVLAVGLHFPQDDDLHQEMQRWLRASMPSYGIPAAAMQQFIGELYPLMEVYLPTRDAQAMQELLQVLDEAYTGGQG